MTFSRAPEDLFNDAIEQAGEGRQSLLDRECGADEALREEVESLLRIAEANPALLDFPNEELTEVELPRMIGRYRVLERCGSGGMGVVYKAEDPILRRTVALKVLRTDLGTSRSEVDRLEAEARYLATLNHPNVATIYSLERDGDSPFLVMEFVTGHTFSSMLRSRSVSLPELLRVLDDVAAGLDAAHQRGIIHRDLKPANVMISDTGVVKLLDFGIAKNLRGPSQWGSIPASNEASPVGAALTQTIGIGTPAYMSPEQRLGLAADSRADIWAFGSMLEDCLISWPAGTQERVRSRIEKLCEWCHEQSPEERPASIDVVRKEISSAQAIVARQGSRRLLLAAILVAGALGSLVGLRAIQHVRAFPVLVRPSERSVEAEYSDGTRRYALPPAAVTDPIDGALVAARPDGARLIVGWTREGAEAGGALLFWNRKARLIRHFETTEDCPFTDGDGIGDKMYRKKRFVEVREGQGQRSVIDVIEFSHYFPSVLRRFSWNHSDVQESYRLYHAGHMGTVYYSNGLRDGSEWLWLSGRIRDGGLLREAVDGVRGNTHYVACFDGKSTGIEVYPLPRDSTNHLAAGKRESARGSRPFLYFVVRGFSIEGDRVLWTGGTAMLIVQVVDNEDGGVAVLLKNTVRMDIHPWSGDSLEVRLSVGSEGQRLMDERAKLSGVDASVLTRSFLAESVVTLVDSWPGLKVTGDFRDLRGRIQF